MVATRSMATTAMSSYGDDPTEATYHDDPSDRDISDDDGDEEMGSSNDEEDMDSSDDDEEEMDSSDDDEEEMEPSPESTYAMKAYAAYCAYAGSRPLQILKALPSTQKLVEVMLSLDLQWAPGLCSLLNAPHPPAPTTLATPGSHAASAPAAGSAPARNLTLRTITMSSLKRKAGSSDAKKPKQNGNIMSFFGAPKPGGPLNSSLKRKAGSSQPGSSDAKKPKQNGNIMSFFGAPKPGGPLNSSLTTTTTTTRSPPAPASIRADDDFDGMMLDDAGFVDEVEDDNDLTFPPADPDAITESCPICNVSLAGVTSDQANAHVNACLDGNPTLLPPPPVPATAKQRVPKIMDESQESTNLVDDTMTDLTEGSKRFASRAAIARPGQANPFTLPGDDDDTNALISLPEFSSDNKPAWAVYLLILQQNGQPPLIYIGSGTHKTLGVEDRLNTYSQGEGFSTCTAAAIEKGYSLTHKKILVSTPIPRQAHLLFPARALFHILETALSFGLYAYEDKSTVNPTLTNPRWAPSIKYGGLCSHTAWSEGLKLSSVYTSGLVGDELEAAILAAEQKAKEARREYQKQYQKERRVLEKQDPVLRKARRDQQKASKQKRWPQILADAKAKYHELKKDPVKYAQHRAKQSTQANKKLAELKKDPVAYQAYRAEKWEKVEKPSQDKKKGDVQWKAKRAAAAKASRDKMRQEDPAAYQAYLAKQSAYNKTSERNAAQNARMAKMRQDPVAYQAYLAKQRAYNKTRKDKKKMT